MMRKFAISSIPQRGFDFVIFDKQLKDEVVKMNKKNTNTLYLLPRLGYEHICIPYTRRKREVGKSRWTLQKKIKLFVDSFVSFFFVPIRAISVIGSILGFAALIYVLFAITARLTGYINGNGWSATMVVILFVSSFQMIALGIIVEYVWRSLDASRNRPIYIMETIEK